VRILYATSSAESSTLGIEKELVDLSVAQKARGSDVMIAIDRQGVFTETCRDHGIGLVVHERLSLSLEGMAAKTPEENAELNDAVQEFIACLKSFHPDIIHCYSATVALVAISAGNRLGIPCALTVANPVGRNEARRGGYKKGLKFAALCLTEGGFEKLLDSDIPTADVYYLPHGSKASSSAQPAQTGAGHSPNLIVVGSLELWKGVDLPILAMLELQRRLGPSCPVLNIYGDGPRRPYLTEMSTILGLGDAVRFHGFKTDILEYCSSSDILVMPSRGEIGPLVVLEAMSRGMPIVSTDVGDVGNMLPDRRYGRVIPPDSAMALADAIESLIADLSDGHFDPDLLIERHRSLYSIERFAERTEAVYNQILLNSVTVQQAG
jgi:glycosyltransferase involved in cell wall biosynthesis